MKYIRTNDNQIINVGKLKIDYDIKIVENYLQVFCKFGITPVETYEIIKQADTIEELCNVFVYIKHFGSDTFGYLNYRIDTTKNELYNSDGILHYKPRKELEIYGAIWTKKGLIYIAKVSEEGELKLFKEELE